VKIPEAEPIHKRASERVLRLIFKISVIVEKSKRKVRIEIFEFEVMGLIRSAIAKGCSMIRLETCGVG
jgi:DNA-directed RNA polymerase beta' subunit